MNNTNSAVFRFNITSDEWVCFLIVKYFCVWGRAVYCIFLCPAYALQHQAPFSFQLWYCTHCSYSVLYCTYLDHLAQLLLHTLVFPNKVTMFPNQPTPYLPISSFSTPHPFASVREGWNAEISLISQQLFLCGAEARLSVSLRMFQCCRSWFSVSTDR